MPRLWSNATYRLTCPHCGSPRVFRELGRGSRDLGNRMCNSCGMEYTASPAETAYMNAELDAHRIERFNREFATTGDCKFVRTLRHRGLSDEHIAAVLDAVESTCLHCWDDDSDCACWNDE